MASKVDTVKRGVDHCLIYLEKLDKFGVDEGNITYKGKVLRVEKKEEQNNAKKAESLLREFVQEKEAMVEELRSVRQALAGFEPSTKSTLGQVIPGSTGREGMSSDARNTSTASVSNVSIDLQSNGKASLKEMMATTFNFPHKLLTPLENFQESYAHAAAESITQIPTAFLRSSDPAELKARMIQMNEELELLKQKQERDTRQVLIQEFLESMKRRSPSMTEDEALKKLIHRNAELIDRLAAEMNARIAANENSLENINIQNRPTKVAEQYSRLMSNEWLAAKDALDERSPQEKYEKRKNLFLTGVLEVAERKAEKYFNTLQAGLAQQLKEPLHPQATLNEGKRKYGDMDRHLPSYVLSGVCDYLRQSADYVNLDPLIQEIHNAVLSSFGEDKKETEAVMRKPEFSNYVKQSARIAWKMVLQKPPLSFKTEGVGKKWSADGDLDLALYSEPHRSGAVVRYYKYPGLYQGEKRLVKGVVVVN